MDQDCHQRKLGTTLSASRTHRKDAAIWRGPQRLPFLQLWVSVGLWPVASSACLPQVLVPTLALPLAAPRRALSDGTARTLIKLVEPQAASRCSSS